MYMNGIHFATRGKTMSKLTKIFQAGVLAIAAAFSPQEAHAGETKQKDTHSYRDFFNNLKKKDDAAKANDPVEQKKQALKKAQKTFEDILVHPEKFPTSGQVRDALDSLIINLRKAGASPADLGKNLTDAEAKRQLVAGIARIDTLNSDEIAKVQHDNRSDLSAEGYEFDEHGKQVIDPGTGKPKTVAVYLDAEVQRRIEKLSHMNLATYGTGADANTKLASSAPPAQPAKDDQRTASAVPPTP